MLRTDIISSLAELERISAAWDSLLISASSGFPMMSYAWVSSYLEHLLVKGETWYCVAIFDGSEPVAIMPLVKTALQTTFGSQVCLRPPLLSDILVRPGYHDLVLRPFFQALNEIKPKWFMLKLSPVSAASAAIQGNVSGAALRVIDSEGFRSVSEIHGTYDDFAAHYSGNHRRNLLKARRRLQSLTGVRTLFLKGSDAVTSHLDAFMRIEASGYKGRDRSGGSPILSSPERVAFEKAFVSRMYERRWLEWHILMAENKMIAMHLAFKTGMALSLYKISFDEEYESCSPGKALIEEMFKHLFETRRVEKVNWINHLPFHDHWNVKKLELSSCYFYRAQPGPVLLGYLPRRLWTPLRDSRSFGFLARSIRDLLRKPGK